MPRRLSLKLANQYLDTIEKEVALARLALPEVLRRARYDAADGYPTGGDGVGGGSGVADPTPRAAMSPIPIDPVGRGIERFNQLITEIGKRAEELHNVRTYIQSSAEAERGRQSTIVQCNCCSRDITNVGNDRRKSGYCSGCYEAWRRYAERDKDPSRVSFEVQRRQQLAAEVA